MTAHQLLKTVFFIPPVVVLAFVVRAIRVGRVRAKFLTYERASNPTMFWVGIAIWLLLALLLALSGVRVWLST